MGGQQSRPTPQPTPRKILPANEHSQPSQTTYRLILVRHGYSCANVMEQRGNIRRAWYTDPELTKHAREYARNTLAKPFQAMYLPEGEPEPFVGASVLLRAQQTAHLLTGSSTITVIPYISEVAKYGVPSVDNQPLANTDPQKQRIQEETLPGVTLDKETYYNNAPNASNPSVPRFQEWFSTHADELTENGARSVIFVTHGGFLKRFLRAVGSPVTNVKNFDAFPFTYDTSSRTFTYLRPNPPYWKGLRGGLEPLYVPTECPDHGCRKPACGTRKNRPSANTGPKRNSVTTVTTVGPIETSRQNTLRNSASVPNWAGGRRKTRRYRRRAT